MTGSQRTISPFERIRQSEDTREFWSARALAEVLGYTRWELIAVGVPSVLAGIVVRIPIIFVTHTITINRARARVKDYEILATRAI